MVYMLYTIHNIVYLSFLYININIFKVISKTIFLSIYICVCVCERERTRERERERERGHG